jgi:hypothetical protein
MSTLYIFGIGGTGSRVIRSLTMLLAAGVELKNCDRVVPIIIDPDATNGDKQRTIELLKTYQRLRSQIKPAAPGAGTYGQFFGADIQTLASLARPGEQRDTRVKDTFEYSFSGMEEPLRDYLRYTNLPVESQYLVDLLFDPKSLDENLKVGFKGSPNVGSVVLNQLVDSPEFQFFGNEFRAGDRIFFISSIFGGTGAAGFPLLLKNLRDRDAKLPHIELLNTAPIGALSLLPYFSLKSEDSSAIDSNTFITKTKAALAYYQHNLTGLNAMYYLGDQAQKQNDNHEGGISQQNNAHFIEVVGALAVLDFLDKPDSIAHEEHFYEFGLERDENDLRFESFDRRQTLPLVGEALTRFHFFATWLQHHLGETMSATYATNLGLKNAWDREPFYQDLRRFLFDYNSPDRQFISYTAWLRELRDNSRRFRPFNLRDGYDPQNHWDSMMDLLEPDFDKAVAGKELKKKGLFGKSDVIDPKQIRVMLDKRLSQAVTNDTASSPATAMLRTFTEVMDEVVHGQQLPTG